MSDLINKLNHYDDTHPATPGEIHDYKDGIQKYTIGLVLAAILTALSFWAADSASVWAPSMPALLAALAIGQMGVHLVFFLHISSGPESTNNILALCFGIFVVALVVFGSIIIMTNLNEHMLPMDQLMNIQIQR
ncbi:MAG: cytochrome o ubiquinol oxidase subunit IV [Methylophilaceae bacterium]|nr:cytochrome o ubiquinol oxidase subunit IV [Methylophilaceae bacterium]MDG1446046.1 cytochrome o ubiquinol oxidase subunit IV [Methylophilaceae bacterium]MDG2293845.1 cytochrome o ubiquinol oxidase subunit IV [Methylophilaceae bacterium]